MNVETDTKNEADEKLESQLMMFEIWKYVTIVFTLIVIAYTGTMVGKFYENDFYIEKAKTTQSYQDLSYWLDAYMGIVLVFAVASIILLMFKINPQIYVFEKAKQTTKELVGLYKGAGAPEKYNIGLSKLLTNNSEDAKRLATHHSLGTEFVNYLKRTF